MENASDVPESVPIRVCPNRGALGRYNPLAWLHLAPPPTRLTRFGLEAIQKRALAEGLPYQTLIASLLHKYATGRLKEV